jgi:hypothetical protein
MGGSYVACSQEPEDGTTVRQFEATAGPVLQVVPDDATEYQVEATVDALGNLTNKRVRVGGGTPVPGFDKSSLPPKPAEPPAPPHQTINPALAKRLHPEDPNAQTEVVVSVAHNVPFTGLPKLRRDLSRSAVENGDIMQARAAAIAAVDARRKPFRDAVATRARQLGAVVTGELVMGNGLSMTIPDAAVAALAKHPGVLEIDPRLDSNPPPSTISNGTSLATGMNGDFWRAGAGTDGSMPNFFMGDLDTGCRSTHTVFNSLDSGVLGLHRDCAHTTNDTCINSPFDPNYNDQDPINSHGTGVANIIMGGNSAASGFGLPFRGASKVELDYFNVYTGTVGDFNAVSRGFHVATIFGDDVIVGELQLAADFMSAPSVAADMAFDNGIAVIAAEGNTHDINLPASPGNAHKAMAVGDYDAVSGAVVSQVSNVIDGRFKPDFQAPTNVDAAGSGSDTSKRFGFNGTSGATAFAAGAAGLMYEWYAGFGLANKPGNLYTALLAQGDSGSQPGLPDGTGKLKMRSSSQWTTGQITLGTQTIDLTWTLAAGRKNLRLAIWWPEGIPDPHNDVDLKLFDASGNGVAISQWSGSVWEKVVLLGNLPAGTYTFRFVPFSMPRPSQVVYYTAVVDFQ